MPKQNKKLKSKKSHTINVVIFRCSKWSTCAAGSILHKFGEVFNGQVAGAGDIWLRHVLLGSPRVERGTSLSYKDGD